jgi:NAD+ diphosphatase
MTFIPAFNPPPGDINRALWFVFLKDRLLVKTNSDGCLIPDSRDVAQFDPHPTNRQYLGTLDGLPCFAAELPKNDIQLEKFELKTLRELFFAPLEEEFVWIAGRANQLVDWSRSHQFCGRCGHRTRDEQTERAKVCPACGLTNYPRVSPAVIVAVVKNNQILLANNKRFKSGYYSVLAGFVEPGENLEECVVREVREEVGISVKNIRYYASQPWPFPNSLMVGFLADYAAGEIEVDPGEIDNAGWFDAGSLPSIPPKITIARDLIDWFVAKSSKKA